jgi:hypothetical protein
MPKLLPFVLKLPNSMLELPPFALKLPDFALELPSSKKKRGKLTAILGHL